MSVRLLQLPESLGKVREERRFDAHSAPSGPGPGGGWFLARTHSSAETKPKKSTPTFDCLHICEPECAVPFALPELNRWCLVWGLYSTSKGHLWHLRSHTNDDAQRSFATTKAEQKNWHEREVNKHKSFNKTFFFFCWIHYKGFHCFSSRTTQQKEKARSVESHDWLRSVATFLSASVGMGLPWL